MGLISSVVKVNKQNDGFTLVELMITVVISSLIMAAVYSGYSVNQKVYNSEAVVVEMQQNLRAAMFYMANDIRMAGYDPTGNSGATICSATRGEFSFQQDLDENGTTSDCGGGNPETNEYMSYGFSGGDDGDRDGVPDAGNATEFRRAVNGAAYMEIASNIERIEFNYILADGTTSFAPADLSQIEKVQVSLLASSGRRDPDFTGSIVYEAGSGDTWGPYNDNIRRRLLVTTIRCRNMGI